LVLPKNIKSNQFFKMKFVSIKIIHRLFQTNLFGVNNGARKQLRIGIKRTKEQR
jgi:hypothetical protein